MPTNSSVLNSHAAQVVTVAVEGDVDAAVARRLIAEIGLSMGPVYGLKGKSHLDKRILSYNNAARWSRWLVLRDLDAPCAPELLRSRLPNPSPQMHFRIAVREIEAWLLADRTRIAQWLRLPVDIVPIDPEALEDPKSALIQLARRSRSRLIRDEMSPATFTSARVGPGYTGRMIEFAANLWRPRFAADSSSSLARCLRCMERWKTSTFNEKGTIA